MAGVGIVLAWFGYTVLYYGLDIVTGGNDPFVDLIWPGRYVPTPKDGASSANPSSSGGSSSTPGPLQRAAQGKCNPFSPGTWISGKCSPACLFLKIGCGL